jgi:hypothetical protein
MAGESRCLRAIVHNVIKEMSSILFDLFKENKFRREFLKIFQSNHVISTCGRLKYLR